jgi:biotin transporter BioY
MKTFLVVFGVIITAILLGALLALLTCVFFMLAWNFLIPVFHQPQISFWQSFAIVFIISLVGSFFKPTAKID